MPSPITISQLNRQIAIKKYVFAQDDGGGNIKVLVKVYNIAASIEQISNSYILEQLQLKYGEAYRMVIRYEPDRILTDNDDIIYQNRIFKTKGVRYDNEAQKRFLILTTSTSNTMANTSGGTVYVPSNEYHYTATGGEITFHDDKLINWTGSILVFRDKVNYRVVKTGSPTTQQVLYDMDAGSFTFNQNIIPLAAGEAVDVYQINQ